MKTILFILCFAFSAIAQTDTVFCIQIMSTKNIHLVRAEHLGCSEDIAHVEQVGHNYRILIPYSCYDECYFMLSIWQRMYKDAFITTRCKKYFNQYCKPFYTTR